jgi:hypothetical protein
MYCLIYVDPTALAIRDLTRIKQNKQNPAAKSGTG